MNSGKKYEGHHCVLNGTNDKIYIVSECEKTDRENNTYKLITLSDKVRIPEYQANEILTIPEIAFLKYFTLL